MFISLFALTMFTPVGDAEWTSIKQSQGRLRSLQFNYEGDWLQSDGTPLKSQPIYTGLMRYTSEDPRFFCEIQIARQNGHAITRHSLSATEQRQYFHQGEPRKAHQGIGSSNYFILVAGGNVASLIFAPPVFSLMPPELIAALEFEREERIDGRVCKVYVTKHGDTLRGRAARKTEYRWWIDAEADGNVRKYEMSFSGRLATRTRDVKLVQLPDAAGTNYWVPVSAVVELYRNEKGPNEPIITSAELVSSWTFRLVASSAKINVVIPKESLQVAFDSTLPKTDYDAAWNAAAKSAAPTNERPKMANLTAEEVKENSNLADEQLLARARLNASPETNPWLWGSIFLGCGGLLVLLIAFFARKYWQ